jgi:hypothetical protein
MKLFVFVFLFSMVLGQAPDEEFNPEDKEIDDDPDINKWVVVTPNCYRPYGYERPVLCFNNDINRQEIIQLYPECSACPTSTSSLTTTTKTTTKLTTTTLSSTRLYSMPKQNAFSEEFVFGCFLFLNIF